MYGHDAGVRLGLCRQGIRKVVGVGHGLARLGLQSREGVGGAAVRYSKFINPSYHSSPSAVLITECLGQLQLKMRHYQLLCTHLSSLAKLAYFRKT